MERAVIYLRVSTGQQTDGTSLETQRERCRAHCTAKGYTVVDEIVEVATGINSMKWRPEFGRVREMLRRGEADVLLVWKFDRMSRDSTDNAILHREVWDAGRFLESTLEGRIANTREGHLMLAVYGYAGEKEADSIKLRTQEGLAKRVSNGEPLVGKFAPFGYQYAYEHKPGCAPRKVGLMLDEEIAPIVLRMFQDVAAGTSINQLTRQLNTETVLTPTQTINARGMLKEGSEVSASWSRQRVRMILTSPTYYGHHIVNRWRQERLPDNDEGGRPHYVMRLRPAGDAALKVVSVPAIVSEEMWQQVQTQIAARKWDSPRRNSEPEATLLRAGFAICGHCGARMVSARQHDKRVYVCSRRRTVADNPALICPAGAFSVIAAEVDADVWQKVSEIAHDTGRLQRVIKTRQQQGQEMLAERERELATTTRELQECQKQRDLLIRRLSTEEDDGIYATLKQELKRVESSLKTLEQLMRADENGVRGMQMYLALMTRDPELMKPHEEIVDETKQYQQRRAVLTLLGVQVRLFAAKSDYAKKTGQRWQFTFAANEDSGMMPSHMSRLPEPSTKVLAVLAAMLESAVPLVAGGAVSVTVI
jgi:site-specific DNA recombinase